MDVLEVGVAEVQAGLKSHLMLIQDRYGCTREEALELAAQIAQDQKDLAAANPEVAEATVIVNPNEAQDEAEGKDEQGNDKGGDK